MLKTPGRAARGSPFPRRSYVLIWQFVVPLEEDIFHPGYDPDFLPVIRTETRPDPP
ncbi:MAG: hypothetical protein MI923_07345 [Phycisphaerales bacterium]|nr:hypothetical protein [Phycisphaerales bacterium]